MSYSLAPGEGGQKEGQEVLQGQGKGPGCFYCTSCTSRSTTQFRAARRFRSLAAVLNCWPVFNYETLLKGLLASGNFRYLFAPSMLIIQCSSMLFNPIGSMYGIYANIGGILMVNVTIYSLHGSYGLFSFRLYCYPLVNVNITMENHHFQWVNPLFLWPFSIAMLVITRGYSYHPTLSMWTRLRRRPSQREASVAWREQSRRRRGRRGHDRCVFWRRTGWEKMGSIDIQQTHGLKVG